MFPGIRILRFDRTNETVAVRYLIDGNVWRLLHIPIDELRALMDDDAAFPI